MVKIENLKAYRQLTEVLPKTKAKRELFVALNTRGVERPHTGRGTPVEESDLWNLFLWENSRQGHGFWLVLADEIDSDWRNKF